MKYFIMNFDKATGYVSTKWWNPHMRFTEPYYMHVWIFDPFFGGDGMEAWLWSLITERIPYIAT